MRRRQERAARRPGHRGARRAAGPGRGGACGEEWEQRMSEGLEDGDIFRWRLPRSTACLRPPVSRMGQPPGWRHAKLRASLPRWVSQDQGDRGSRFPVAPLRDEPPRSRGRARIIHQGHVNNPGLPDQQQFPPASPHPSRAVFAKNAGWSDAIPDPCARSRAIGKRGWARHNHAGCAGGFWSGWRGHGPASRLCRDSRSWLIPTISRYRPRYTRS